MPGTTRIIQDAPAEVDEFGGKGHDRTANALVDAVSQMEGRDGAIGLEGSWGAGKSTVIRIAEKKLAAHDRNDLKHSIFTFDLWAHQSDDFRRAFLESFVAWLSGQHILSSWTLDNARNQIRDRVKSVTVESSKRYNAFGIVFILILPLLPFIYAWLGPSALKPASGPNPAQTLDWTVYLAASLVAILYLSVFVRFFHLYFVISWPYISRSGKSFADAASNCVSMFSKDVESETTTQNIRESDPTTIEFHRIFRNLLSEAQSRGVTIIHVLDNIDRLHKDSVAGTWSEIRALFAIRGEPARRSHDSVLVILPYDKQFVMSAIGEKGLDKEADFIEKTFSRTLRVAPPISHDWRKFFLAKLKECFSDINDAELNERLFRLLRYSFQKTDTHASPRRIIHFINELGALDAQWQRTISLEACAIYILNRKEIEASSDSLRKEETIDPRYIQIANVTEINKEIAALAFNVEPTAANQVLLQDPISRALTSPNPEDLKKLASIPGFDDVLQDVLQDPTREWLLSPNGVLDNVCINLASLDLDDARARVCWRDVAGDIKRLKESIYPNANVLKSLSLVIPGIRDARTAPDLAHKLQSLLGGSQLEIGEKDAFDYGVDWFNATITIQDALQPVISEDALAEFRKKTKISLSPAAIIGCAHQCAQARDYKLSAVHPLQVDINKLEHSFIETFDNRPSVSVDVLNQIIGYFTIDKCKGLLTTLVKSIHTDRLASEDEAEKRAALLQVIHRLCSRIGDGLLEPWKDVVLPLAVDGSLAVHAFNAGESNDKSGSAKMVAILMALQDAAKPYAVPGDHPHMGSAAPTAIRWFNSLSSDGAVDDEFPNLIAQATRELSPFGYWLDRGLQDAVPAILHAKVLSSIIRLRNMYRLNVFKTLAAYSKIKTFLSEDEAAIQFLLKLAEWKKDFDGFLKNKDLLLTLPSELITDIQAHGANTSLMVILEAIDKVLTSATQEDWKGAFNESDNLLRLYLIRHKDVLLMPPTSEYKPALFDHATYLLKGLVHVELSPSDWHTVIDGLGASSQSTLAADVLLAITSIVVNEEGLLSFIRNYSEIAARMKFIEQPNVSLNQIFSKLIVSENSQAQAFSDQNLEIIDALLANASEDAKGTFIETIKSKAMLDGANEERLRMLRGRYGIVDEALPEEGDDDVEEEVGLS
ncbi:KAP family NTPase [Herbaspirillum sp. WGmk3]|uniref:P-loop NTPase fold protein n=1 Tax=Herbaspirillum sp. WGmk3 TaxID=2919925 RepID=UPI002090821A|nr:P-loop NTPase fold protein [Herbaspirillum sp. WGmk3]MCO4856494.1 KAP family NTPase [Herbaspirillum sp. WGmk3]